MYGNKAGAYKQVAIMTTDPGHLVILCYEGVIQNLNMAVAHYSAGALEEKAAALAKALDFIGELNRALDFEKGGEIAASLHALYNYISRRIMEGDLKRNITAFEEVIQIITELKSAWEEILTGTQQSDSRRPLPAERDSTSGFLRKVEV